MTTYDYPLCRPPAEAENIIIQVTLGCSYNNCSFCSMYKTKKYQQRSLEDIYQNIDTFAVLYPYAHKILLADGDALTLTTERDKLLLELNWAMGVSSDAFIPNILRGF